MAQVLVTRDALQLVGDNPFHLFLDAVIVFLHLFLHTVIAVLVSKIRNDGNRPVSLRFSRHLRIVHDNLRMENLLFDTFVEIVGHRTDKHALRQAGNLARRDKAVHLRVNGGGDVLPVDGYGLTRLQDLSEPLRKRLGGFAHHLTGEDVADSVHHHLRFLVPIVTYML